MPEELFEQVQQIIGDESRNTVRDYAVKHLLSGIARCGNCPGEPHLRVAKNRGYLSYGCSDKFDTQMAKDKLDAYVEEAVLTWLGSAGARSFFQSGDQEKRAERARVQRAALERQLKEAQEKATTFRADGVTPLLSLDSLAAMEERLLPMIQAAKDASGEIAAPPLVKSLIESEDRDTAWEVLTIEQRRTVLRSVVNIRLNKARTRGVRSIEPGRIGLVFANDPGFKARPRYARAIARVQGQRPAAASETG